MVITDEELEERNAANFEDFVEGYLEGMRLLIDSSGDGYGDANEFQFLDNCIPLLKNFSRNTVPNDFTWNWGRRG